MGRSTVWRLRFDFWGGQVQSQNGRPSHTLSGANLWRDQYQPMEPWVGVVTDGFICTRADQIHLSFHLPATADATKPRNTWGPFAFLTAMFFVLYRFYQHLIAPDAISY